MALVVKNLPPNEADIRDLGPIPASGRYSGRKHGKLLQYSCLESPMDRGAWWLYSPWVSKSWTRLKQLSPHVLSLNFPIIQWNDLVFIFNNRKLKFREIIHFCTTHMISGRIRMRIDISCWDTLHLLGSDVELPYVYSKLALWVI